jgi:predicted GH43/DUF377 family glycosyl hydrolase
MVDIIHLDGRLTPDPARVVIRPFHIAPEPRDMHPVQAGRALRIVNAVLALSVEECQRAFASVDTDFDGRHWQTEDVYARRCAQVLDDLGMSSEPLRPAQRELIGAYFCHEYSYAAAAVMNPSVVPHPNQEGLGEGDQRFVMSLRTVGEGHISSIAFREGILGQDGTMNLWPPPPFSMAAEADGAPIEGEVIARRSPTTAISGAVIFPFTRAQRNGLEDLRLVHFTDDDGAQTYYGTYTAYSGAGIASEMLATPDFSTFRFSPMRGDASRNKGMGLFPKRVGGRYAMIGRQDGESLYFMESDDLLRWDGGEKLLAPKFPWELVQIGNCGAPIELDEGWLVLTHGVGAMRQYAIGAALLDKANPRKVLGRLAEPLISPSDENREGYVPNVCYTCGGMRHGDKLFLPYAVADSSVLFSLVGLKSLVAAMK